MLKTESKRRRTKQQIEEVKQAEVAKENAMRKHMAQIKELQAQKEQAQDAAATNRGAAQLISDLINAGINKQTKESSFVALGANGESQFDYGGQ